MFPAATAQDARVKFSSLPANARCRVPWRKIRVQRCPVGVKLGILGGWVRSEALLRQGNQKCCLIRKPALKDGLMSSASLAVVMGKSFCILQM